MNQKHKVTTFKERFAELFDESEKTTLELSKELHVSNQTISAWKLGTRSPKEPTIIAIANYFHVNVDWLFGFNVPKHPINSITNNTGWSLQYFGAEPPDDQPKTDEARILARGIDKLDPEQRAQALAVVKAMFAQHPELFE